MDAPVINHGPKPATLKRCGVLSAMALGRYVDRSAEDGVSQALGALALRECWPDDVAWPARPVPRKWHPGESILARGQEIFEQLAQAMPLYDPARLEHYRILGDDDAAEDAKAKAQAAIDAMPIRDLQTAGSRALLWSQESLVSGVELEAAKDFSGAPPGA